MPLSKGRIMRFARIVFTAAGIWGLTVLSPLLFLREVVGRQYPPAITHPDFYFGFVAVAMAWQIAFLIIGRDPARLRPMMPAAMLEKFGYIATLLILYSRGELQAGQVIAPVVPDGLLGMLFVVAYLKVQRVQ
jgi:hypothetical protein